MCLKNKKYEIIKKAIENEISVDNYLFEKLNYGSKKLSIFKMLRFKDKIPLWISVLSSILIPIYFAIEFFVFFGRSRNTSNLENDQYFLSFSNSPKVIAIYEEYASDIEFLQCINNKVYCFVGYLSPLVILKSFIHSIILYFKMIFFVNIKYYLHLTAIFELILFYEFVIVLNKRNINKICVVNHYDRWLTVLSNIGNFDIEIIPVSYTHLTLPTILRV